MARIPEHEIKKLRAEVSVQMPASSRTALYCGDF
jgi:hypothetical protein